MLAQHARVCDIIVVPGETVLIYCTGLGAVQSPPADGTAASGQSTLATPLATIGGISSTVASSASRRISWA